MAKLIWRALLRQFACLADAFARESAGSNNAARMAMMAITTNSSISVKPSRASELLFTTLWTTQSAVSHVTNGRDEARRAKDAGYANRAPSRRRLQQES